MKIYELTYLIPATLTEEEIKSLQERIHSAITEKGGVLEKVEELVKVKLGSPIKNQEIVMGSTVSFHSETDNLEEMENKLRAEKQILRHLITIKKKHKLEAPRRMPRIMAVEPETETAKTAEKPKKVEIKEIEKKLEEILGE